MGSQPNAGNVVPVETAISRARQERPTMGDTHHKYVTKTVPTGNFNWTRGTADCHEENLPALQDSPLTGEFTSVFDRFRKRYA